MQGSIGKICFTLIAAILTFLPSESLAETKNSSLPKTDAIQYPNFVELLSRSEKLTVFEAIERCLGFNSELLVAKASKELARHEVRKANGLSDTYVRSSYQYQEDRERSGSTLTGSSFTSKDTGSLVELSKTTPQSTQLAISWEYDKESTDDRSAGLSPEWEHRLSLEIRQPLLRGAWAGRPAESVRQAKLNQEVARIRFQAAVIDEVQKVLKLYWDQVLEQQTVAVYTRALGLAKDIERDAREKVRVGTLARLEAAQAKVAVEQRRDRLLRSQARLITSAVALSNSIGSTGTQANTGFYTLTDTPKVLEVEGSYEQSIHQALEQRPEIRAQKLEIEALEAALAQAKNGVLPDLAVVGGVQFRGLAGNVRGDLDADSSFDFLEGDSSDAFDRIDSGEDRTYGIGIELNFSLGNNVAQAKLGRVRTKLINARTVLKQLQQTVINNVRSAFSNLENAGTRLEITRVTARQAKKNLEAVREKAQYGYAPIRDVLDAQLDLENAELAIARSITDYQLAFTELYWSRGGLLRLYGITFND